jgi:hypothetical protein
MKKLAIFLTVTALLFTSFYYAIANGYEWNDKDNECAYYSGTDLESVQILLEIYADTIAHIASDPPQIARNLAIISYDISYFNNIELYIVVACISDAMKGNDKYLVKIIPDYDTRFKRISKELYPRANPQKLSADEKAAVVYNVLLDIDNEMANIPSSISLSSRKIGGTNRTIRKTPLPMPLVTPTPQASIVPEGSPAKPTATPKPTPKPTATPDPYKEYKKYDYKELLRYSENYEGVKIKLSGKVIQVIGNKNEGYELRIATKSGYDNVVYAYIDFKLSFGILDGDKIDIWGIVREPITYQSIGGTEITIPAIDVRRVEVE